MPRTTKALLEAQFRLEEILAEPKRTAANLDALGLHQNGGVANIIAVYNLGTPEEKDYWGRWYFHAQSDVREIAEETGTDFRVAAAVTAVLSPGNRWAMNVNSARNFLRGEGSVSTRGGQNTLDKCRRIVDDHDFTQVRGPKVTVFFESLVDPEKFAHEMVLDGHAINIWRGRKLALNDTQPVRAQERTQMVADYKEAARQLGISPQGLQACSWYLWKYSGHLG